MPLPSSSLGASLAFEQEVSTDNMMFFVENLRKETIKDYLMYITRSLLQLNTCTLKSAAIEKSCDSAESTLSLRCRSAKQKCFTV